MWLQLRILLQCARHTRVVLHHRVLHNVVARYVATIVMHRHASDAKPVGWRDTRGLVCCGFVVKLSLCWGGLDEPG
jgi:hypothetical protein